MNMIRTTSVIFAFCLGLLLYACDQNSADRGEILATVNGELIGQNDYEQYLKLRQSQNQQFANEEEKKKAVLNEMIDRILMVQHAEKKNINRLPEVQKALKRNRENILARAMISEMLKEKPITDEEVKKKYDEEAAKTHKIEYKVRHILYKEEEEAKQAIKKLKGKTKFSKLAEKDSMDVTSGKKGGELGWVNQGMVVPEFFAAITAMKKGTISQTPVKTSFGYHVIKLEDSKPWLPPSFDQVKPVIYRHMQTERINSLLEEIKTQATIQIH